jgi:glycosyltransferase involved in cell wall biosynthesis
MKIAVIIPSFRVKDHILDVISRIPEEVWKIYVVDDCCPDKSGDYVKENCQDARVAIIYNAENLGVGGAVMAGYQQAIDDGSDILVKIDGDGQMNPSLLPRFVKPIISGSADYTKGNRFYELSYITRMPKMRILGNSLLSLITKISSGYWNIFDPTNGYTALHVNVAKLLPFDKISKRYFFESDILFRLNIIRSVVTDIPMDAVYGDEKSNIKISKILLPFMKGHIKNTIKRIFYNYFLRDMNAGTFELVLGILLLLFGSIFGILKWLDGIFNVATSTSGTVMLAALPVILGTQFLLAFLNTDISNVPNKPIQNNL